MVKVKVVRFEGLLAPAGAQFCLYDDRSNLGSVFGTYARWRPADGEGWGTLEIFQGSSLVALLIPVDELEDPTGFVVRLGEEVAHA